MKALLHQLWRVLKSRPVLLLMFFCGLQIGHFFLFTDLNHDEQVFACSFLGSKVIHHICPNAYAEQLYKLSHSEKHIAFNNEISIELIKDLCEGLLLFMSCTVMYFYMRRRLYNLLGKHVQGAELISGNRLKKTLKNEGKARFKIGPVPLPIGRESDNLLYIGPPGCGKKVDLMRNLHTAISNDFPCIIFDGNGDMISHFYREDVDHILNPADLRSINWQLPGDLKYDFNIDAVSTALFFASNGDKSENVRGAREIFNGILRYCARSGKFTNQGIEETLGLVPGDLKQLVNEKPLHPLIGDKKIMPFLYRKTRFIKYIDPDKKPFSITDWIEKPEGNIFLSGYSPMDEILRPLYAVFIDMIARQVIQLPETRDTPFFFFLDDAEMLPPVPSMPRLLHGKNGRAAVFMGTSSLYGLLQNYDSIKDYSILYGFKTKLVFNTADPTAKKHMSRLIGEEQRIINPDEILKKTKLDGTTMTLTLVHPDDISRLPPFTAYLKIGECPAAKIEIEKPGKNEFKQVANRQIVRDDLVVKLSRESVPEPEPEKPEPQPEKTNPQPVESGAPPVKPEPQPVKNETKTEKLPASS